MATEKKPVKGILKSSSSFDKPDLHPPRRESKETKWDEMNILATHHPPGKDYGHMKIDEPPTPYSKYSDQEEDENDECNRRGSVGEYGSDELDPDNLSSRLQGDNEPRVLRRHPSGTESSSGDDEEETEEERAKRKLFEQKRKLHYNEFQAVKLAKQLMEEEDEDEDEDEVDEDSSNKQQNNTNSQTDSSQLQDKVETK